MPNYKIQFKNAFFSYGEKPVFSDLSFNVKDGEVFCVVGPNGCGKTTLMDCILGLLKLDRGDILMDQGSIKNIKPRIMAEKVAYVPQTHQSAFPYEVKDIVLMGRAFKTTLFSSPTEEDRELADQAMEKVGILHLSNKPYTQISGGECQLVMIARALAQQPGIIIMDEPTSHLDFKNELLLLETVAELVKKDKITVVMATHFPNHAYFFETNNIPTTLALMNNGIFEQTGSPHEVLNEDNIKRIYNINSRVLNYNLDNMTSIRQIVPLSIIKDA